MPTRDLDLDAPLRLDRAVAGAFRMARSAAQAAIAEGRVRVDGTEERRSARMLTGSVELTLDDPAPLQMDPLPHLLDDPLFVVVDKPAGLLTHPVGHRLEPSVVEALRAEGVLLAGSVPPRVGVVHRLDRDTSGVLLLAKDARAHAALARQFKVRTVEKVYLAVVRGVPRTAEGRIDAPLTKGSNPLKRQVRDVPGAREAVTEFRVRETFPEAALLEVRPHTGRTHQIRAHLAAIGTPVLGDPLYFPGGERPATLAAPRLLLHAHELRFDHPESGERISVTSPIPNDIAASLDALRAGGHPQR